MKSEVFVGNIRLSSPVLLAPLAGYTDLPFRLLVRSFGGVGLAFTEMLNPDSLIRGGGRRKFELTATNEDDRPLGYQIYGKDPDKLVEGARWVEERGARLIDINMGCPQKKISGRGAGAGMMRKPDIAIETVRRVVDAVAVPVTVKIRLGWDSDIAVEFSKRLEEAGASAITVHGRTRKQGFSGAADWEAIGRVTEAVRRIPVFANGDVVCPASARRALETTGCSGVMLGRQPIKTPWVLRDIARDLAGESPLPPPSREERVQYMLEHFDRSLQLYGERIGVLHFRKWIPRYLSGAPIDRALLCRLMLIREPAEWREHMTRVVLGAEFVRV